MKPANMKRDELPPISERPPAEEPDSDEVGQRHDEDDDVGTDERGNEMLKAPGQGAPPAPDVSSDRGVPATNAETGGSLDRVRAAPLGIREIEGLEDDAKGG